MHILKIYDKTENRAGILITFSFVCQYVQEDL